MKLIERFTQEKLPNWFPLIPAFLVALMGAGAIDSRPHRHEPVYIPFQDIFENMPVIKDLL